MGGIALAQLFGQEDRSWGRNKSLRDHTGSGRFFPLFRRGIPGCLSDGAAVWGDGARSARDRHQRACRIQSIGFAGGSVRCRATAPPLRHHARLKVRQLLESKVAMDVKITRLIVEGVPFVEIAKVARRGILIWS